MTERLIGYEHDGVPLDTARRLAGLGFAAFAIDLFGKGIRGKDRAENAALIGPFREDRRFLQARIMSYISMLRKQPEIDSNKIAAIGYCFGGLSVLDLARSGADVCGVVSIHGLFTPPEPAPGQPIRRQTILTSAPFTMPMPMPMPFMGRNDGVSGGNIGLKFDRKDDFGTVKFYESAAVRCRSVYLTRRLAA